MDVRLAIGRPLIGSAHQRNSQQRHSKALEKRFHFVLHPPDGMGTAIPMTHRSKARAILQDGYSIEPSDLFLDAENFHKAQFLFTGKLLDGVFARHGRGFRRVFFLINQLHRATAAGVLGPLPGVVLLDAFRYIGRIPGIEAPVRAAYHVDKIAALC